MDDLISGFSHPPSQNGNHASWKGKEKDTGAIVSGMIVEVSGPPGVGKSSIVMGLALSARTSKQDDGVEVLIVGE